MTTESAAVIGGVDTHAETHHAALITTTGQHVADREFFTTPAGYAAMVAFLTGHGQLVRVGVEGTSSYGAGLLTVLRAAGIEVVEVIRPTRTQRRRGKSDPIDAYNAAAVTLAGQHLPVPKQPGGDVDAIRALLITRRSAVSARADTTRQIKTMLVTAPVEVRQRFRRLSDKQLIATLVALRPGPATTSTPNAVLVALRTLARRNQWLGEEIDTLESDLDILVSRANPALRGAPGIGPVTAAQLLVTAGDNPERIASQAAFAALTGTAPIPASSGKTTRWRLNRGGDRKANCAIHQIVLSRLSFDPATKAYVARRQAEKKTTKEIMRCLKRAVAREIFAYLTRPQPVPGIDDLRPMRQAKDISLEKAAEQFNACAMTLSRLERGLKRDDRFAKQYRDWLTHQPTA